MKNWMGMFLGLAMILGATTSHAVRKTNKAVSQNQSKNPLFEHVSTALTASKNADVQLTVFHNGISYTVNPSDSVDAILNRIR